MRWFDFAYLKQWWPETSRRKPHVGVPKVMRKWSLRRLGPARRRGENSATVRAATKSEARAMFKELLGVGRGRLPIDCRVVKVK